MMCYQDKSEHLFMFEPSASSAHEITKYKIFSLEVHGHVNIFYQRGCKAAWSFLPLLRVAMQKGGPYINIYFLLLAGQKTNFKHPESKIVVLVYFLAHVMSGLAVLFQGKKWSYKILFLTRSILVFLLL